MPLAGRHELPPLTMGDLSIAADELLRGLGGAGVMTEGDFEALIRMEVTFARKKGEYYACYEFGTAITPDSDQMTRIGTLAMVRLLLRCGSFRACYSKLSEASAAALRRKVAEPSGFAGLELGDTGYETLPALVAACRADGWCSTRRPWTGLCSQVSTRRRASSRSPRASKCGDSAGA